eukprot:7515247-Pyramimonas_sp.AAC.1
MAPEVKRSSAASEIPTVPARGHPRLPFEGSIPAQDATSSAGGPYVGMLPDQVCDDSLHGHHDAPSGKLSR